MIATLSRIVATVVLGLAILAPGAAAADTGALVYLEPVKLPGFCVRHAYWLGEVSPCPHIPPSGDFVFRLRTPVDPAVTGMAVAWRAFESVNYPGWFLRHENYRITLAHPPAPGEPGYEQFVWDSTFHPVHGLSAEKRWIAMSYESANFPGFYIRHSDYHLYLSPADSWNLADDASFVAWRVNA